VRRNKPAAHENHDRWLVSYADFITLLFAFFVVMFATTESDRNKAKAVSDSVREAIEHGQFSNAVSSVLHGKHAAAQSPNGAQGPPENRAVPHAELRPADLAQSLDTLQQGLGPELRTGKVRLHLEGRGLVISLREAAFFASGDDAVAPASFPILAKIAVVIQGLPNPVRLEGHTDSIPIHNSRFRSNWELSSSRAIAMLELFRQRYEIAPERLSVAGYAENAPSDSNDTEEGRAHNRRVDVVVLSAEAIKSEPQSGVTHPDPSGSAVRPKTSSQ
jgi:chemotaxis protein MotB